MNSKIKIKARSSIFSLCLVQVANLIGSCGKNWFVEDCLLKLFSYLAQIYFNFYAVCIPKYEMYVLLADCLVVNVESLQKVTLFNVHVIGCGWITSPRSLPHLLLPWCP